MRNFIENIYGCGSEVIAAQTERYNSLIEKYRILFGNEGVRLFSTPGRTEIAGNHTDHNHGCVIAAAVSLDTAAAAEKNNDGKVVLYSSGYPKPFIVDLNDLSVNSEETGSTNALIRGIAFRLKQLGYNAGGFNAVVQSGVPVGSGLSSSASVEVLIGGIFNILYNGGTVDPLVLAQTGQYAENVYFGKPCGLMDQVACAEGGIVTIDFADPGKPVIEKIPFDFHARDYSLVIVNTGGNHADLTEDYAAIPAEMRSAAEYFGKEYCREITVADLYGEFAGLREKAGDRAWLRAFHFIEENRRVGLQAAALRRNDFGRFLDYVSKSGNSSFRWLQNCYTSKNVREQGIPVGLALTERFLEETGEGACRVHGGGFAGTIQVFIPKRVLGSYIELVNSTFGTGCAIELDIRDKATVYSEII